MLILIIICLASCRGFVEAMRISKNIGEYTGIDTLIKIDGYYYLEDSSGLNTPILISKDGEFYVFPAGRMASHIEVQEYISRVKRILREGSYTISGDTINARWTRRIGLVSYLIFSEKYVIVNNTTLRLIWFECETCEEGDWGNGVKEPPNPLRDDIYRFYEYQIDK